MFPFLERQALLATIVLLCAPLVANSIGEVTLDYRRTHELKWSWEPTESESSDIVRVEIVRGWAQYGTILSEENFAELDKTANEWVLTGLPQYDPMATNIPYPDLAPTAGIFNYIYRVKETMSDGALNYSEAIPTAYTLPSKAVFPTGHLGDYWDEYDYQYVDDLNNFSPNWPPSTADIDAYYIAAWRDDDGKTVKYQMGNITESYNIYKIVLHVYGLYVDEEPPPLEISMRFNSSPETPVSGVQEDSFTDSPGWTQYEWIPSGSNWTPSQINDLLIAFKTGQMVSNYEEYNIHAFHAVLFFQEDQ